MFEILFKSKLQELGDQNIAQNKYLIFHPLKFNIYILIYSVFRALKVKCLG